MQTNIIESLGHTSQYALAISLESSHINKMQTNIIKSLGHTSPYAWPYNKSRAVLIRCNTYIINRWPHQSIRMAIWLEPSHINKMQTNIIKSLGHTSPYAWPYNKSRAVLIRCNTYIINRWPHQSIRMAIWLELSHINKMQTNIIKSLGHTSPYAWPYNKSRAVLIRCNTYIINRWPHQSICMAIWLEPSHINKMQTNIIKSLATLVNTHGYIIELSHINSAAMSIKTQAHNITCRGHLNIRGRVHLTQSQSNETLGLIITIMCKDAFPTQWCIFTPNAEGL